MTTPTAAAVSLDGTTVAFRLAGGRTYTAVETAQLSVADGEFVAIVGPTGCGKSTLLNVAAGLLKPAAGSVRIFGQPLAGLNHDAGYLFQADALFPWKTSRSGWRWRAPPGPTRLRRRSNGWPRSALAPSATATRICCRVASASASGSPRC